MCDPFESVWTLLSGWITGKLGVLLTLCFLLGGIGYCIVTQKLGALFGWIAVAVIVAYFVPTIEKIFSKQVSYGCVPSFCQFMEKRDDSGFLTEDYRKYCASDWEIEMDNKKHGWN